MEGRGQEREIGLPNSMSYNHQVQPPQISPQDSPVKLPLAPIISAVSTRRGSSIFSPSHTHLNSPDPTTLQTSGAPNSQLQTPPPQAAAAASTPNSTTSATSIRYRECLKNHAASMGGHVLDGCGEFMPGGDDGTPESLRCAACDCHRNFHRKEVEGEPQQSHYYPYIPTPSGNNNTHRPAPSVHGGGQQFPPPPHHQRQFNGPTPPTMVNFGGGGPAAESSSEDLNMFGGNAVGQQSSKKRHRTKFNQEQKDRMHEFAMRLGWRIQKQDEGGVEQFCNEVGVKRQVFKVWMHNNKQSLMKKQPHA